MNLGLLSPQQTAAYLRTLPAIRERCSRVHDLAQKGKLQYFDYHPEQEDAVASFCVEIITVRASGLSSSGAHGDSSVISDPIWPV